MKTTLTVVTAVGTLTRTTARPYAYVVTARGRRLDVIERQRVEGHAHYVRKIREYTEVVEGKRAPMSLLNVEEYRTDFLPKAIATKAGLDAVAAAEVAASADALTQPVTSGEWSSRLDLALKAARKLQDWFQDVRVFEVATGKQVAGTMTGQ
jgi:hypothetical protein